MRELPRISGVEMLILDLLVAHGESYGLELIESSRGKLKRGTIYVTLDRMEDKGYVESWEVEAEGRGPARRMYRLTGHGSRVVAAWEAAGTVLARGALQ